MIPRIFTPHTGYLPDAEKLAILDGELAEHTEFEIYDCATFSLTEYRGPIRWLETGSWGRFGIADFSDWDEPGYWQVSVGVYKHRSFPFRISREVYVKTFRMAFQYLHLQRCGQAVPGYHGICHLDDAIRRDTGEYIDTSGGWHDAGDLRKWMVTNQFIINALADFECWHLPGWHGFDLAIGDVLAEARWENDYYLKMQDPETGQVWHDVAGGLHGDNSDNRWTDNKVLSGDERHIEVRHSAEVQWAFIEAQAGLSRAIGDRDGAYAMRCRQAALRCLAGWKAEPRGELMPDARAVCALLAVHQLLEDPQYLDEAVRMGDHLLELQQREPDSASGTHGFFYRDRERKEAYKHWGQTGYPLQALVRLFEATREERFQQAARRYIEGYLLPLAEKTPFGIIPFGLYKNPAAENAVTHRLDETWSYRFFTWREATSPENAAHETETFEHGGTSHLLSHAVALAFAWQICKWPEARRLALKQLEWVMGANPFGACLMTGGGMNTPYPHSRFTGLVPGGILNGFNGGFNDLPYLSTDADQEHWETTEYWNPHAGHYLQTISTLLKGERDIPW